MYQQQNQNQNQAQMNMQNVQAANAQANNENASELAQSSGQVSQLLLAKAKQGFEFGTLNQSNAQNQGTINTQSFTMNGQNQNQAAPNQANAGYQTQGQSQAGAGYQVNQQDQTELAASQGQMSQILKNQSN